MAAHVAPEAADVVVQQKAGATGPVYLLGTSAAVSDRKV